MNKFKICTVLAMHMKNLLLLLFLFTYQIGFSQGYSSKKEGHQLNSKVFGDEREFTVFLPYEYAEDPQRKFKVVYVFDGQFDELFNYTTATYDYFAALGMTDPCILVAIKTKHRQFEFTPKPLSEETTERWGANAKVGGASVMANYLAKEVFPMVQKTYRCLPYRSAIGHSLGGTFVAYCLLERPALFNEYLAISPNFDFDEEQLVGKFEQLFQSTTPVNKFFYLSVGSNDRYEDMFRPGIKKVNAFAEKQLPEGLKWQYRFYENIDHMSMPIACLADAIAASSKLWQMTEEQQLALLNNKKPFLPAIKSFYTDLSDWAGYPVSPSASEANSMGYLCLNADKTATAIKVFTWALQLHPENANLYDSKAEALEKAGELEEAKRFYQKAIDKWDSQKDGMDEDDYKYYRQLFVGHLNRLK